MKVKKVESALLMILLVVLLVLLASCEPFVGEAVRSGKTLLPAYGSKCYDSDGGINYTSRGDIKGLMGTSFFAATDFCKKKELTEYYCAQAAQVKNKTYLCPFGCVKGACVTPVSLTGSSPSKNFSKLPPNFEKEVFYKYVNDSEKSVDGKIKHIHDSVAVPFNFKEFSGDGDYLAGKGTNVTLNNGIKIAFRTIYVTTLYCDTEESCINMNKWYGTDYVTNGVKIAYDVYLDGNKLNLFPLTEIIHRNKKVVLIDGKKYSQEYGDSSYSYGIKITPNVIDSKMPLNQLVNLSLTSTIPGPISSCQFFYDLCLNSTSKDKPPNTPAICGRYCPKEELPGFNKGIIDNFIYIYPENIIVDIDALHSKIKPCFSMVSDYYKITPLVDEVVIKIDLEQKGAFGTGTYGFTLPDPLNTYSANQCTPLLSHEVTHWYTWMMDGIGQLFEGLAQYTQFNNFDLGDTNLVCGEKGWTYSSPQYKANYDRASCYSYSYDECGGIKDGKSYYDFTYFYDLEKSEKYNSGNFVYPGFKEEKYIASADISWKLISINYSGKSFEFGIFKDTDSGPLAIKTFKAGVWDVVLEENILFSVVEKSTSEGYELQGIVWFNPEYNCVKDKLIFCQDPIFSSSENGYVKYYNYSSNAFNSEWYSWENFYNSGACFWKDIGHDNVLKFLTAEQKAREEGAVFYRDEELIKVLGMEKYTLLSGKYGLDSHYAFEPGGFFSGCTIDCPFGLVECAEDLGEPVPIS